MSPNADVAVFDEHESAARGYCRRFNVLFSQARGSRMLAANGSSYIDFLAGCGALNYGHNDPDMSAALVAHIQRDGLAMGLDLHTDAKRQFLTLFSSRILAARGLDYRVQFTGPTGANAVEAAMKLARKVTGRQNIIAFTNGYHGVSMGALAATGNQYNRMGLPLPGITRMPYDKYFGVNVETADYLERMLEDPSSGVDPPAAILLEIVQGEGGLNAARPSWVRRVAELAQRCGALLIVDDVQAGCGRTGTFFSFEGMALEPDLVVLSKSISGYGLPMSLLLVRPDRDQWRPAEHNGTFRGNTHAFVTAAVAVDKYWSNDWLARQVERNASTVGAALRDMAALVPGAYRKGRGMMQGLHVGTGELADAICRLCFERGLIIETSGPRDEVVKVLAAINTPTDVLEQGLAILRRAVVDAVRLNPGLLAPAVVALDKEQRVAA